MHESVRWLASKGRVDECVEVMADIARINGRKMDQEAVAAFKAGRTGGEWKTSKRPFLRQFCAYFLYTS